MIFPTYIPGIGTIVPDDVAYVIAHWLTNGLRDARRNAEYLSADVVETVQRLDLWGAG